MHLENSLRNHQIQTTRSLFSKLHWRTHKNNTDVWFERGSWTSNVDCCKAFWGCFCQGEAGYDRLPNVKSCVANGFILLMEEIRLTS